MSCSSTPALARKIQRALGGEAGYVPLTPHEECLLGRQARSGSEEARWALVMANQNFVRSLATRYLRDGIEHEDLVSEGLGGLLEAAVRYDPERGIKFITYGAWWIKRAILRYLRTFSQAVHVPKYKHHELLEFRRIHAGLTQALGRSPSLTELEHATGASHRELAELLGLATPCASLERDNVAQASQAADAEDRAVLSDTLDRVRALWSDLSERQQHVLVRRFGLDGARHETLAALGDELGLTKERVRQIEKEACRRLRVRLEAPPPRPELAAA